MQFWGIFPHVAPALMPGSDDFVFLSAAEQGRLIRSRKLSPVELVRACFDATG